MYIPASYQPGAMHAECFSTIVRWARENNPFYARWLADPDRVPVLPRRIFQQHNYEILNGQPPTLKTSGSLGMPVYLANSPERAAMNRADAVRYIQWIGGPLHASNLVDTGSHAPGPTVMSVSAPVDEQIGFIERRYHEDNAVEVVTYPSNAERLAEAVIAGGVDMSYIRRFGLIAESLDPYQEQRVRLAFPNAFVWTTYSSMEFGVIAVRYPLQPGYYHLMSHKLGVEILDQDDRPCAEGQMGRVVVTDYHNRLTPFIRYEIGDYAVPGACPCGRIELPGLQRVVGKTRSTLLLRSGARKPFVDLSMMIRDIPGLRQFQVIQETVDSFTVRVASDREVDRELRHVFDEHFGHPTTLAVKYEPEILPEHNGKYHTLISKV